MLREKLWTHDPKTIEAQVTSGRGYDRIPRGGLDHGISLKKHLAEMELRVGVNSSATALLDIIRWGRENLSLGLWTHLMPSDPQITISLLQWTDFMRVKESRRVLDVYNVGYDKGYHKGEFDGMRTGWLAASCSTVVNGKVAPFVSFLTP